MMVFRRVRSGFRTLFAQVRDGLSRRSAASPRLVLWGLTVFLALPLRAEETLYRPPAADLPQVLFAFDGGRITRDDLAAAVLRAARESAAEGLAVFRQAPPENFLGYLLNDLRYRSLGAPGVAAGYSPTAAAANGYTPAANIKGIYAPCGGEALGQWRALAAQSGGESGLRGHFAQGNPPLSPGDVFRQFRLQALARVTGIDRLPPWEVERLYQPKWYGLSGQRVASAGGFDFTDADLAQYLLREAGDYELQFLFARLIQERIVLAEAEKMGLNTGGRPLPEIEREVFAPFLQPESLQKYWQSNPGLIGVGRCRICRVPDGPDAAEKLAAQRAALQQKISGKIAFFVTGEAAAAELNPEWFGLDYLYSAKDEKVSPLNDLPAAWRERLPRWKAGEITGPLRGEDGQYLLLCEELLPPRQPEQLFPLLSRLRLRSERQRLIDAVLNAPATRWFWQPAARTADLFPPP